MKRTLLAIFCVLSVFCSVNGTNKAGDGKETNTPPNNPSYEIENTQMLLFSSEKELQRTISIPSTYFVAIWWVINDAPWRDGKTDYEGVYKYAISDFIDTAQKKYDENIKSIYVTVIVDDGNGFWVDNWEEVGLDFETTSQSASRFVIRNNVFEDTESITAEE